MAADNKNGRPAHRGDVPGTAAFLKFMKVLQAVGDATDPPTVPQLVAATGFPRPTVYRIVAALISEGMMSEGRVRGTFDLGPRLISLAAGSRDGSELRQAASAPLARLRDKLGETVHLAVHSGDEMIYIDKLESLRTVRMASRIGTRVPMHSSSVGKAWLASIPPDEMRETVLRLTLSAQTEHAITSREILLDEIAKTRERGFALDLQENELEICCYGQPVIDRRGKVVACISVSIPLYRFDTLPSAHVTESMTDCIGDIVRGLEV